MSNSQVTLELYGHFRCLQVFIPNKTTYTKNYLTQWIPKLIGNIETTEQIFTGLGHGKLS